MEGDLTVVITDDHGNETVTRRIPTSNIFKHPDGILTSMLAEDCKLTVDSTGEPYVEVNNATIAI